MKAEQPLANYNGNPQTEDGYTRLANELLEAMIKFKFSERQYKIVFCIIRKTYGFNKKQDDISLSQLSELSMLPINHVSVVINQLVKLNVLFKSKGKYAHILSLNKSYDTWGLHNMECLNVELHNEDLGVTHSGQKGLHNVAIQNTNPKDNTKEIAKVKTSAIINLQTYLDNCKLNNVKALPDNCCVFKTAQSLKIDELWLQVCWAEFKQRHIESKKRQKDWVLTFNNCVKDNWYKIWYMDNENNLVLSSQGRTLIKLHNENL